MSKEKQATKSPVEIYQDAKKLHLLGQLEEAQNAYLQALSDLPGTNDPRRADIYHDYGALLRAKGHPRAAIACYRRALMLEPSEADTWLNLSNALLDVGDVVGALDASDTALRLDPEEVDNLKCKARALFACRRFDEAVAAFEAALALDPSDEIPRIQLGMGLLHLGLFKEGFAAFEARLGEIFEPETPDVPVAPIWHGESRNGRSLLVQSEQGLGDILQFSRFLAPLIEMQDGPVICQTPRPLLRLFERSFPDVSFFETGAPAPAHSLFVPIASLAERLGTDQSELCTKMPYLSPTKPAITLPDRGRPKVGLTWSGNRTKLDRSCPFTEFMRLFDVGNVDFFSFQRGTPREDIAAHGAEVFVTDLGAKLADFDDDAALVHQLDLVISIDTAFCHLAGALNVPCWVLLTPVADWRFMTEGRETPWYPSFRLFRMGENEGWAECISNAKSALHSWADAYEKDCISGPLEAP